jgi:hypothetical protein
VCEEAITGREKEYGCWNSVYKIENNCFHECKKLWITSVSIKQTLQLTVNKFCKRTLCVCDDSCMSSENRNILTDAKERKKIFEYIHFFFTTKFLILRLKKSFSTLDCYNFFF